MRRNQASDRFKPFDEFNIYHNPYFITNLTIILRSAVDKPSLAGATVGVFLIARSRTQLQVIGYKFNVPLFEAPL
jgi:hypothetical protein